MQPDGWLPKQIGQRRSSCPGLIERDPDSSDGDSEYDSDADILELVERIEADSESDDESNEEDEYLEAVYLLRNKPTPKPKPKSTKMRASIIFSVEDKNGVRQQYLGLLDTGCIGSLVVEKYLVLNHL